MEDGALEAAVTAWIEARLAPVVRGAPAGSPNIDDAIAALPEEHRAAAARTLRRIVLGSPRTARVATTDESVFRTIVRAFVRSRGLALVYRGEDGRTTERRVEPHGLLLRPPLFYLLAWDAARSEPRTLRVDRILSAAPMIQTFVPKEPPELFENLDGLRFDVARRKAR